MYPRDFMLHWYSFLVLVHRPGIITSEIKCTEGQSVTHKVSVHFSVQELPVTMYGCIDGLDPEESLKWPGPPHNLAANVSVNDGSFRLSWRPPDDSSAVDITGFLIEMYMEEMGDTASFRPSACFLINSKLTLDNNSSSKAIQDTIFHIACQVKGLSTIRVNIITLPLPRGRDFKETEVFILFKPTTTRPATVISSTALRPVVNILTESQKNSSKSESLLAACVGVILVSVCVIVLVGYMIHRRRRFHGILQFNNDNTDTTNREHNLKWPSDSTRPEQDDLKRFHAPNNEGYFIKLSDSSGKENTKYFYATNNVNTEHNFKAFGNRECENTGRVSDTIILQTGKNLRQSETTCIKESYSDIAEVEDLLTKTGNLERLDTLIGMPQEYRNELQSINMLE